MVHGIGRVKSDRLSTTRMGISGGMLAGVSSVHVVVLTRTIHG